MLLGSGVKAVLVKATPPCKLLSTCCTRAGIVANGPAVYCDLASESANLIRKVQPCVCKILKPMKCVHYDNLCGCTGRTSAADLLPSKAGSVYASLHHSCHTGCIIYLQRTQWFMQHIVKYTASVSGCKTHSAPLRRILYALIHSSVSADTSWSKMQVLAALVHAALCR